MSSSFNPECIDDYHTDCPGKGCACNCHPKSPTPKDENVSQARLMLKAVGGLGEGGPYMSDTLAALESAINEIIGEDEVVKSTVRDVVNELKGDQRNRLRSWIDGK